MPAIVSYLLVRKEYAGAAYSANPLEEGDTVVGQLNGKDTLVQVGRRSLSINRQEQEEPESVVFDIERGKSRQVISPVSSETVSRLHINIAEYDLPFKGARKNQQYEEIGTIYDAAWETTGKKEPKYGIGEKVVGWAKALVLS